MPTYTDVEHSREPATVNQSERAGATFLHERSPAFHAQPEVELVAQYLRDGGERIPNQPTEKIAAYLGFLGHADYVNDGILTGDSSSIARQVEATILHADAVPDSYFDLFERVALERGLGAVSLTAAEKESVATAIESSQRISLLHWAEYLTKPDEAYPSWFRWYAFTGVSQLGSYDVDSRSFRRRSNSTTTNYPELHEAAVRTVFKWLVAERINATGTVQETLQTMTSIASGNFGKLYGLAVAKSVFGNETDGTMAEGWWQRYPAGSDPAQMHYEIRGNMIPWCIAKSYHDAVRVLKDSDMDVYFTPTANFGKHIPRVAIRTSPLGVEEVRGILQKQEVETGLLRVVDEKLENLTGGNLFQQRVEDMKRVTELHTKVLADPSLALSTEDVRFIYELDREVASFGFEADPRIRALRALRGERDREQVLALLPELILSQQAQAYQVYLDTADALYSSSPRNHQPTTLQPELFWQQCRLQVETWRTNGTFAYVADYLLQHGGQFLLSAGPHQPVPHSRVIQLMSSFNQQQSDTQVIIDNALLWKPTERIEQSPLESEGPVHFHLLPLRTTPTSFHDTEDTLQNYLTGCQQRYPNAAIRVPSLYEAACFWRTLQANQLLEDHAHQTVKERSFIWHFDVTPTKPRAGNIVQSFLDNAQLGGVYYLGRPDEEAVRLAVG